MRFLHTSDWHVGRTVRGRSRDAEHEAALQEILKHARDHAVDCLIVAGDIFDTAAPSADSERLVYDFFRELHGAEIPAVVIAGNHDHPRRFDAIAPLLRSLRIHLVGLPVMAEQGGVYEVESRDGRERALVAALPWVSERKAVEFATLSSEPGASLNQYGDQVIAGMTALTQAFRPETVNILTAHFLVDGSLVGARGAGGERELHMTQGIYGVRRERIPVAAQYVAAGHVHKAQSLRASPAAWYSGSILQLDFGEREQDKSVNLVEVHPGQPAKVTPLPIESGRKLVDIGSPLHGVSLNELTERAAAAGDAWLRVFVDMDMPVTNLAAMVKETLPNAVHVQRTRVDAPAAESPRLTANATELFQAFYRSRLGQGREPSAATVALFAQLLDEETHAAADA